MLVLPQLPNVRDTREKQLHVRPNEMCAASLLVLGTPRPIQVARGRFKVAGVNHGKAIEVDNFLDKIKAAQMRCAQHIDVENLAGQFFAEQVNQQLLEIAFNVIGCPACFKWP